MNFRLLSKVQGILLVLIGIAMAVCLIYAWFEDRRGVENPAVRALSISCAITLGLGGLLYVIGWKTPNEILRREAIVTVGLGWILSALVGSVPFLLCKPGLSFAGAYFESMSGFTTTGSTVIRDLNEFPKSILLWRSLTQWLGGGGILVMFVAVLSFLGVGSRSLMRHESSLNIQEASIARIRDIAMSLWKIYIVITIITTVGLLFLGMNLYDAISHALTTVSTGGFSPKNESVGFYKSLGIEIWLTVCMLSCGISFMLYLLMLNRNWKRLKAEEEARDYIIFLLLVWLAISLNLSLQDSQTSFVQGLRRSFFTIVSVSTTTGFGTENFDTWPAFSKIMLLVLMAVGGCAGSTAGGLKMNRLIIFWKVAVQELVKSYRPNRVFSLRLNGNPLEESVRLQTSYFLALGAFIWLVGVVAVAALEPHEDLATTTTAVTATMFNIGPGLSDVGPTQNFADLYPGTLFVLSLLMALGRLEFMAVLVLFLPSLWKRY